MVHTRQYFGVSLFKFHCHISCRIPHFKYLGFHIGFRRLYFLRSFSLFLFTQCFFCELFSSPNAPSKNLSTAFIALVHVSSPCAHPLFFDAYMITELCQCLQVRQTAEDDFRYWFVPSRTSPKNITGLNQELKKKGDSETIWKYIFIEMAATRLQINSSKVNTNICNLSFNDLLQMTFSITSMVFQSVSRITEIIENYRNHQNTYRNHHKMYRNHRHILKIFIYLFQKCNFYYSQ